MRRIANTRIAGLVSALVAGALAAYALRSAPSSGSAAHAQQPAVEVRTQVITRTVHVVRHERPPRPSGGGAAGGASTRRAPATATATLPRTGSSGSHAAGTPTAVGRTGAPRTRTSGAPTVGTAHPQSGGAVRTRTSGGSGGGSSSGAVRTRTSGGGGDGGDHGGQHDD